MYVHIHAHPIESLITSQALTTAQDCLPLPDLNQGLLQFATLQLQLAPLHLQPLRPLPVPHPPSHDSGDSGGRLHSAAGGGVTGVGGGHNSAVQKAWQEEYLRGC